MHTFNLISLVKPTCKHRILNQIMLTSYIRLKWLFVVSYITTFGTFTVDVMLWSIYHEIVTDKGDQQM